MHITQNSAGVLKVPGAVIVKDGMSMAEKVRRVEESKVLAQALFGALLPYAVAKKAHPAITARSMNGR